LEIAFDEGYERGRKEGYEAGKRSSDKRGISK